jgi:4-hydroxy-tetrahydrodipicolinate synthase
MITPFDAAGQVDLDEAARIARYLLANGSDGLVVAGTTGESPALEDDEKLALFETVKRAVGARANVVAGTGSNNTQHSVRLTKQAEACGVDGILAVVPYYSKPTQDGMLGHFGEIAEATRLPIIVYNIPSRTGINLQPATLLELAGRYRNIVGVKESSGDFAQFAAILRERRPGFSLWSGDDHLFLPALAVGGDGLISVAAHLCGRELREMGEAYLAGDVARAARIYLELSPIISQLFVTTSPIPVKWAMGQLGFSVGPCRSPLGAMPASHAHILGAMLAPYQARARETLLASYSGTSPVS